MRKLPDGAEVSLDTGDGSQLALKSGRSRFTLQVLPESDFPDLTTGEFPTRFALPAATLKKLIDRTQFAISTEETRYYLNGIYLHVVTVGKKPMLRAVATDGHRLAQAQFDAPAGRGEDDRRDRAAESRRRDPEAGRGPARPRSTSSFPTPRSASPSAPVVLTSKLIDGTFPDYVRVIPQGNDKIMKVDRGEFADAVDRVSTISSERGRAVKLALTDGKMTLSVNNPDSGSAVEEVGVDYAGRRHRDRLQLALPARRRRPAGDRHRRVPLRRSRLADAHPRRRRRRRALRPHADAGVRNASRLPLERGRHRWRPDLRGNAACRRGIHRRPQSYLAKLRRNSRGVTRFSARNWRLKLARLA